MKVFVKVDDEDNIININSEIFIEDTSDWIEIDEGEGDKYAHAQGNYLPMPLTDENGCYRYKYENGAVCERSAAELAADLPIPEPAPPTNAELAAAIAELAEVICGG